MEKTKSPAEQYWDEFLDTADNRRHYGNRHYTAWFFCEDEQNANALAALVLEGTKRATASLESSHHADGEPVPKVGDLSIITDWNGTPQCIIETTAVTIRPFKDVPPEFAAIEGEGDKSLDYWRRGHRLFFTEELQERGESFHEELRVVCEEFQVIHQ